MIQCKECSKEISSDAPVCPHCGKKRSRGSGKILLLCLSLLVVCGFIIQYQDSHQAPLETPKTTADGSPNLATGDHVVLSEDTIGCTSSEAFNKLIHAEAIKDPYAVSDIFDSHVCVKVKVKTLLLLENFGWTDKANGDGMLGETRVLSGPYAGEVIWFIEKDLQPVPQSTKQMQ
jgi:hypothetical protein